MDYVYYVIMNFFKHLLKLKFWINTFQCKYRNLSDFINNILICLFEDEQSIMDLEQHKGKKLLTEFSFLGELLIFSQIFTQI